MGTDLYALDHEITKGRLSIDDIVNHNSKVAHFNDGHLSYDAFILGKEDLPKGLTLPPGLSPNYDAIVCGKNMPRGYTLSYGLNQKKETEYSVSVIDLLKASEEWTEVAPHTLARKRNGIQIRRPTDRVPGFRATANFSEDEWEIIKEYALKSKRSRNLKSLTEEAKRITHSAIKQIARHFNLKYSDLPEVILRPKAKVSKYTFATNKIQLKSIEPWLIFEEASHYLHFYHKGTEPEKYSPLEGLFDRGITEAIGYYCIKLYDPEYSITTALHQLYRHSELIEKETEMIDKVMGLEIDDNEAKELSNGIIRREILKELHFYLKEPANLWRIPHHLGIRLGEMLWEQNDKRLVKKLITEKSTQYPLTYFRTMRKLTE